MPDLSSWTWEWVVTAVAAFVFLEALKFHFKEVYGRIVWGKITDWFARRNQKSARRRVEMIIDRHVFHERVASDPRLLTIYVAEYNSRASRALIFVFFTISFLSLLGYIHIEEFNNGIKLFLFFVLLVACGVFLFWVVEKSLIDPLQETLIEILENPRDARINVINKITPLLAKADYSADELEAKTTTIDPDKAPEFALKG